MGPIVAAVAQMTSTPSISQNIRTALGLMERASRARATMLFLPEAADFIAPAAEVPKLSKPVHAENNEFVQTLREEARKLGLWLNVCIHETPDSSADGADKKCHNTNLVISGDGDILASYRKVHLFDVDLAPDGSTIKESNTTIPGIGSVEPAETPVGTLGLQTCFDLRFSEPAHGLLSKGCKALTYPSAFAPHTGAAHWEALLRGRAIEGQCYVFASAQAGEHYPGRRSYGHAMIVDPWGTVVARCSQTGDPEICTAEVDLDYVAKVRREMPMGW